jgi:hypothetical protein
LEESVNKLLAKLNKKYPLVGNTEAGRLFSVVRRMKAEKEFGVPIGVRSCFAVSVKMGKVANKMTKQQWDEFYKDLCERLKRDYPGFYEKLF